LTTWHLAIAGAALAAAVCTAAWRWRLLSASGAWTAWGMGTAATAAGPDWCLLLLSFFATSVALSSWRRGAKRERTGDVVEKPGARDGWQVLANGGVFAACAVASLIWTSAFIAPAGVGAIAAAAADTWATEIGTAIAQRPLSIRTWRVVPPGTSGAVSLAGSIGLVLGAATMGTVAWLAGFDRHTALAGTAGAVIGALVDTLLGASIQERRYCAVCGTPTEQRVHRCGARTERHGGWRWMTNDSVNVWCTTSGAAAAAVFHLGWPFG
jgi:uncharacterized protein (TIGR00297 family)